MAELNADAPTDQSITNAVQQQGPQWTAKDRFTVMLSSLAFVVSAASLYFTNFYVGDDATARIANIEFTVSTDKEADKEEDDGTDVVAKVAFVNAGNRPIVVLEASYEIGSKTMPTARLAGNPAPNQDVFPLLLPAHDIRVIPFRIPLTVMRDNMSFGEKVDEIGSAGETESWTYFLVRFSLSSLASDGTVRRVSTGDQIRVGVGAGYRLNAVEPRLRQGEQFQFPAIDLLQE
jgi:hypothetical protein